MKSLFSKSEHTYFCTTVRAALTSVRTTWFVVWHS